MRERVVSLKAFIPRAVLDAYQTGNIFFPEGGLATTAVWLASKEKGFRWRKKVPAGEVQLRRDIRDGLRQAAAEGNLVFDRVTLT